jgi:hypothetical protein
VLVCGDITRKLIGADHLKGFGELFDFLILRMLAAYKIQDLIGANDTEGL